MQISFPVESILRSVEIIGKGGEVTQLEKITMKFIGFHLNQEQLKQLTHTITHIADHFCKTKHYLA